MAVGAWAPGSHLVAEASRDFRPCAEVAAVPDGRQLTQHVRRLDDPILDLVARSVSHAGPRTLAVEFLAQLADEAPARARSAAGRKRDRQHALCQTSLTVRMMISCSNHSRGNAPTISPRLITTMRSLIAIASSISEEISRMPQPLAASRSIMV